MTVTFSLFGQLKDRIANKSARVTTVGLGYVGLPLALTISEAGFPVTGFDINAGLVAALNAGRQVLSYLPPERVGNAVASGRFGATSDPARLAEADIVLICVPTPLDPDREPDLAYVRSAATTIAGALRPGQLVVLESTVWPGATATLVRPILEAGGLVAGTDFFLGFSPEREDPGNHAHPTRSIPKIVGADDAQSRELIESFYSHIVAAVVPVSSSATAEAVKLTENTFRSVNIALVNELKVAMDAMGVDIWEVVRAAATKPFGYMPFYPGPGIGGDCIPVSPAYLSWRARDMGASLPIVDLARGNNDGEPARLAGRVGEVLAARGGPALAAARVLVLGVTYKRDVEDTRESPALYLLQALEARGAACDYHDPFFPEMPPTRDFPALAGRRSVPLTAAQLALYDAVVVTTDHSGLDYGPVVAAARLVLDSRNVFQKTGPLGLGDRLVKI